VLQSFTDLELEDPSDLLRSEVARLQTIIASMEQSRSWKLTRPLRSFAMHTRLYRLQRYREQANKKALIIPTSPFERASQVISPKTFSIPNVCGIAHVFYTDLANEIVEAFLRCGTLNSVVITTPTPADELLIDALEKLSKERPTLNIAVLPTENIGRDIYPFLQAIRHQYVLDCDVFLKIHTKKSLHLDEYKGHHWRQQLLSTLCPSPEQTSQISASLHNTDEAWIACPDEFTAGNESWGRNKKNVKKLAKEIDIKVSRNLVFAAGSMFWARSELVKCLSKLHIEQLFDQDKDGQLDGSISHAIERLFGVIAISNSKKFWAFKVRL
jgi:lipopolysaccharide biosynthesis protein